MMKSQNKKHALTDFSKENFSRNFVLDTQKSFSENPSIVCRFKSEHFWCKAGKNHFLPFSEISSTKISFENQLLHFLFVGRNKFTLLKVGLCAPENHVFQVKVLIYSLFRSTVDRKSAMLLCFFLCP